MMKQLNREQERASIPEGGIHLVIAGAGTGKTKTLVEKIKNLIKGGEYNGNNLLVLTFSRKAAGEIRERVKLDLGSLGTGIFSGTFHSFCLNLLKENRSLFLSLTGYRSFPGVVSDDEKKSILASLVKERLKNLLGIPLEVACNLVGRYDGLNKYTLKKLKNAGILKELCSIISDYEKRKIASGLIDFGDMINYSIKLLQNSPSLKNELIHRYTYILIDEFQDTSHDNFELINLLLPEKNRNLFAVGDDWQSIYGFRKAEVGYIIKMKKYFPEVKIHRLKVNYRSRREIVELSNRFIRKNRYRTKKRLVSFKGKGGSVQLMAVKDSGSERELIKEILAKDNHDPGTAAVLFRNNWQIDTFKSSLEENGPGCKANLMTIHASKGLEFETVIIGGVSDAVIPDRSSDIEEERRLFYVALTRAKERLYIISRMDENRKLSRFAEELGIPCVER